MEVNDKIFGKMQYDHRWEKTEKIYFDGKEVEIKVIAKAFSQKPITDEQRESYEKIFVNINSTIQKVEDAIIQYGKQNSKEIAQTYVHISKIDEAGFLKEMVKPKSMIFTKSGECFMLFDCVWDEDGIGVGVIPKIVVGPQDIFM